MENQKVNSGIYMGDTLGGGNYSVKNVIEDFMKTEYEEGFRNEFNTMEALINKLPKDTITGKKKYKSFKLGISDNVRAVGSGTFDRYELGFDDFWGAGQASETVDAEFDTTKLMATFAITDEALLKGTGDGSLVDVLKDQLANMEMGMKHTYNRYIYGSHNGKIGSLSYDNNKLIKIEDLSGVTVSSIDHERDNRGKYHNQFESGRALPAISFKMINSHSLISGMGALIEYHAGATLAANDLRIVGKIWQKDNTSIHAEKVIFFVQAVYKYSGSAWVLQNGANGTSTPATILATDLPASGTAASAVVYSRQLNDAGDIAREYTGLEDIVINSDSSVADEAIIFGVDRRIYRSLRCTTVDMGGNGANGHYVNEEILRDLSDHLALTSPEGTAITLCCANHRIISQVEKALYQFKNYNLTNVGQGMQLGGAYELKFDNYVLYKDKFARDNNLYMLDQNKIGELVRRDFTWITSGEVNGVLQRRPGTEMYEGIMNKYADMYIDAWRCHAALKNCKVTEPGVFTNGQYFSYESNGLPKGVAGSETAVKIAAVADGVKFPQE